MANEIGEPNNFLDARELQGRAAWAFKMGDFEAAFGLYTQAEELYRKWFVSPGDRVYFMQSWALNCLEQLLDDNPHLVSLYRSKNQRFLDEWSEEALRSRISSDRITEALAFRSFRTSYFVASQDLSDAAAAVQRADFALARDILRNLIKATESSTHREADAVCAIARSKIEMLAVQQERQNPPRGRSPSVLASGYLRAARTSRLPKHSRSTQRDQLNAFRATFLSEALKYRAFALLRQMQSPEPSLSKARRYLGRAVKHARRAAEIGGFPENHSVYLSYWHQVVSERVHLAAFMSNGAAADIAAAVQAWQNALNAAEELCGQKGEDSLFPNRFYCLADLRLEDKFLAAARAFRERRWVDCVRALEEWRSQFPQEYAWSWRDVNVHIRLLGAKAILAIDNGDQNAVRSSVEEINTISQVEAAGAGARFFVREVSNLGPKRQYADLFDRTLTLLCEYFTPDSWVDAELVVYREDKGVMESLPRGVHRALSMSLSPIESQVEGAKRFARGAVEALLGYMCDYYGQYAVPVESVPMPEIGDLIDRCRSFAFHLDRDEQFQRTIGRLRVGLAELAAVDSLPEYAVAYSKLIASVRSLNRQLPVVVDILSTGLRTKAPYALEATPDWAMDRVGREHFYLFLKPEELASIKVGKYFLRPRYRKANRISYNSKEDGPPRPVRYVPRWEFWENEASLATWAYEQGVLLEHVRKAIELSKMCKVNPHTPPVGAVIVKDRREIGCAYRGEGGSDDHAEKLAIACCLSSGLRVRDLKNTIMITTLEPCSQHAREKDIACATLMKNYGISKVLIGIRDPNQHVMGEWQSRLWGIQVAYFPPVLADEVHETHKEFVTHIIRKQGTFDEQGFPQ